jgi:hypothetical protein
MTSISRLTVPTGRLISMSTLLPAEFAFEPKKSFICNKTRLAADPDEPKEPKPQADRLASFSPSPIRFGVPSFISPQISSISSSVTAMQPCVQSPSPRKPWTRMSPPGFTQTTHADQGARPTGGINHAQ